MLNKQALDIQGFLWYNSRLDKVKTFDILTIKYCNER